MPSCALAVAGGDCESVTFTVKFEVPAAVGVPVIAPVVLSNVNPLGRPPAVMLQA